MIGRNRHVLKFELPVKTSDATGGNEEGYTDWFTCRGFMRKKSGFRGFETGYDQSVNLYECEVPWRQEIENQLTKDTRIIFESREFSVEHINLKDEKRKTIVIELKEVR